MTAHELARLLLAGDDVPVYVEGRWHGLHDVSALSTTRAKRDQNDAGHNTGPHDEHPDGEPGVLVSV